MRDRGGAGEGIKSGGGGGKKYKTGGGGKEGMEAGERIFAKEERKTIKVIIETRGESETRRMERLTVRLEGHTILTKLKWRIGNKIDWEISRWID